MAQVEKIAKEHPGGRKEILIKVTLTGAEQVAVLVRDEAHDGSWEKYKEWFKTKGRERQRKSDLPRCEHLEQVEKKFGINLSDYVNL